MCKWRLSYHNINVLTHWYTFDKIVFLWYNFIRLNANNNKTKLRLKRVPKEFEKGTKNSKKVRWINEVS